MGNASLGKAPHVRLMGLEDSIYFSHQIVNCVTDAYCKRENSTIPVSKLKQNRMGDEA